MLVSNIIEREFMPEEKIKGELKELSISDECINCGACYSTNDEYFDHDDQEGKAVPKKNPVLVEDEAEVSQVADDCPVGAISLE